MRQGTRAKEGHALRVLMTADTVGGVWTYALELAAGLAPHRVKVLLATMGRLPTEDQRREAKRIANLTLVAREFKLEWMEDPWADLEYAGHWLLDLGRAFEPDVIHLNNYAAGALNWPVPVVVVAHSCVLSWHQAVRGCEAGAQWARYREVVTEGLRGADLIVAPTQGMLSAIKEHYELTGDRQVIFNGCHDQSRPGGQAAKQPHVLAVGRVWDEAKNIAAIVAAAPQVKWPVRVVSMAHPEGRDVQLANVQLIGQQSASAMATLYDRASILAHPARYEPFGLVPLGGSVGGLRAGAGRYSDTARSVGGCGDLRAA